METFLKKTTGGKNNSLNVGVKYIGNWEGLGKDLIGGQIRNNKSRKENRGRKPSIQTVKKAQ